MKKKKMKMKKKKKKKKKNKKKKKKKKRQIESKDVVFSNNLSLELRGGDGEEDIERQKG